MKSLIIGKWKVIESNRPRGNDDNYNAIGTVASFNDDGSYFMIMKDGVKFKLRYTYDDRTKVLELIFSDGIKKFYAEILQDASRKMVITEMDGMYFEKYQLIL